MGFFDFVKEAGEKLLGGKKAEAAAKEETQQALYDQVMKTGLKVENFAVSFQDGVATLTGKAPSQEEREKIVLAVGNTRGVGRVDDQMTVAKPAPEATLYTVKSGDSLSKIAKAHYGDASKYNTIFEANKPMLTDPNKIYPGQVLRIPPINV
ncbi:MAG: peptidoglycan-binding protein LysM [bacterium]|nr:peptidoglycan-binding protein LysM [bacterium]